MKIAVIGGAGVRTPLLTAGLAGSDLPLERVSLYDTDQERLSLRSDHINSVEKAYQIIQTLSKE